jgi:hypothetical protein
MQQHLHILLEQPCVQLFDINVIAIHELFGVFHCKQHLPGEH